MRNSPKSSFLDHKDQRTLRFTNSRENMLKKIISEYMRVFLYPSHWLRDIQHMCFKNSERNGNSFQIIFITFNLKKCEKNSILSSFNTQNVLILLLKMRQKRNIIYGIIEEVQPLSLSKFFEALFHKLIYDQAIFHCILNRKTSL